MQQELQITIVQTELHWESPEQNRELFGNLLSDVDTTNLIVLPEMFTTGFTMNAEAVAEPPKGATLQWMQHQATKHQAAITGSVVVSENAQFYNRLYFVKPDGTFFKYDKKHTFTLAKEHQTYTAGTDRLVVEYLGWKICPLICYDLRFPVWSRNTVDYDVLLYVANWPEKRVQAWDALLKARAIENMAYCVGVNRVGLDGNDHPYVGHSAVYDVLGNRCSKGFEGTFVETIALQKESITTLRDQLQFLRDRDSFQLT